MAIRAVLGLLSLCVAGIFSDGSYLLTFPEQITKGSDYVVSIDILNTTNVDIEVQLQRTVYNGRTRRNDFVSLKTARGTFNKGTTGSIHMLIEDTFDCSNCKLHIRGRGGLQFEHRAGVHFQNSLVSVLIQTDKAIYKPGQRVRFRALAVYPDLKVYTGKFNIEVKDPNFNKIMIQNGLSSPSGVVEGSLDLSEQPPFGDWHIHVSLEKTSDTSTQAFTVADYDLPRFEVKVELPPYKLTQEDLLTGTVKAKYTFGQPVKGMVELHVGPDRGPNYCGKLPKSVESAFEIDGDAKFSIPKSDIRRVTQVNNLSKVRVTAIVKESTTGVRLNGSSVVTYYSNEFNIKFLDNTPSVFKPGLPYTAYVQVLTPDNMPPPADHTDTVAIYTYVSYKVTVEDQSLYGLSSFTGTYALPGHNRTLPANGVLNIAVDIPHNATSITITARYRDRTARKTVSKTYSDSNNYMQLSMKSKNMKSLDTAKFTLQATEPLNSVSYLILARGKVVMISNLEGQGKQSLDFTVALTPEMAPTAHLLAYYSRSTSEVVADSLAFNIDGIFKNKVSVAFNTSRSKPHEEVELVVTADPHSQVNLLAVDQSVLLLKSGNDITADKVENDISKYDHSKKPSSSEFALTYSSKTIRDVFTEAGLVVISDAKLQAKDMPVINTGFFEFSKNRFISPTMVTSTDSVRAGLKTVDRIRKVFPEAWLWGSYNVSDNGKTNIKTTVPDTITSWIASAFATNALSGLGVAPTTAKLTVFRPFFVSLTHPSSVKRNEQAVIQATVFNYLPSHTAVVVTLKNSSYYQSVLIASDGTESLTSDNQQQTIQVASGKQGVVYFPILASQIGVADLEVTIQTNMAADGARRQILIEAEGAPHSFNYPIFIDLDGSTNKRTYDDILSFPLPKSVVAGSEQFRVKVTGDHIGPSLDNIESLLALPTGCGEQSMVKFAPDLYIGQYLKATGQLTDYWNGRITRLLSAGYQRQLTYQRGDGGFSAFGNGDESGSTWLTAIVSRTFSEAREFIYVDPSLLTKAVDWLIDRQNKDGSFNEFGRVLDQSTQGSKSGPALTAYVLLALMQNRDVAPISDCQLFKKNCYSAQRLTNATAKAMANLESVLGTTTDQFSLAVMSYALGTAKSRRADDCFNKLLAYAHTAGPLTYWSDTASVGGSSSTARPIPYGSRYTIWRPPHAQARPIDILISSYALLAYTSRGRLDDSIRTLRWLTTQRNSHGGFASTQDTTVALQALSSFAKQSVSSKTNLNVKVTGSSNEVLDFSVTQSNALVLQVKEFTKTPSSINLHVDGTGTVLAEMDYSFNVNDELSTPSFDVSTVLLDDDLDSFNLMICTKWLWDRKTGMVVQEISIPSGFSPDLTTLGNVVGMKRSERKGNTVAVYFDEIGKTSTCYSLLMTRTAKVAKSEKSYVRTFDYYEPSDQSTVFYQPRKLMDSTICDVCDKCCT